MSEAELAELLALARAAVAARVEGRAPPAIPEEGAPSVERGAFVTLRTQEGELRGCIGTFRPQGSVAATVAAMAGAAAAEDPRFPPVRPDELPTLKLHVSLLQPLRPLRDVSDLVVGRDGVLVQHGWHRGTLLPQVAVEQGWDAQELLRRTCLKAGLPPTAWQEPGAKVEVYGADEIGD